MIQYKIVSYRDHEKVELMVNSLILDGYVLKDDLKITMAPSPQGGLYIFYTQVLIKETK